MTGNKRTKTQAFKLLKEDFGHREIAEKLKVSLRTIQRWAKELEPVPVKVLVEETSDKTPPKNPHPSNEFDLTLPRSLAIRLLHLSEAAIGAVEGALSDPDISTANKLKAAKLAGDWVGLGVDATLYSETSIMRRAERAFDTQFLPHPSDELPTFEPFSRKEKEVLNPLTGEWEIVS